MVWVDPPASDTAMGVVFAIAATTGTVVDLVHVFDGFTEGLVLGNWLLLDQARRRAGAHRPGVARARDRGRLGRRALRGDQPGRRARYRADPARAPHRCRFAGWASEPTAVARSATRGAPTPPRRRYAPAPGISARWCRPLRSDPVAGVPARRSARPPSQLGAPTVPVPGIVVAAAAIGAGRRVAEVAVIEDVGTTLSGLLVHVAVAAATGGAVHGQPPAGREAEVEARLR